MFRKLKNNNYADVGSIGFVIGLLITLIVSILVFYNIAASIDVSDIDSDLQTATGDTAMTAADNATTNTLEQAETFYSIAPIIAIVVIAVVILGYVKRI